MIIDNVNKNRKLFEWLRDYTENGSIDIITGYFTIGAVAYINEVINKKIKRYRFVIGDIANISGENDNTINLLNETLDIETSLALVKLSKEAVQFLEQNNVEIKTLEPNFCHAKAYLFYPANNDGRNKYFVTGSSNLTEAGIGLKAENNVELNLGETGDNNQYQDLVEWFENIWQSGKAHLHKTLPDKRKINFKEYLIKEISEIFKKYTPQDLYYKTIFEIFYDDITPNINDVELNKQIGKLEETEIYKKLYEFQKGAVRSLINILNKHNGAILADAVGLGKTWTTLAVMKYFQMQGREITLFVPKKLEQNWSIYKYSDENDTLFANDRLKFRTRRHTDLEEKRFNNADILSSSSNLDTKKLFVIDESHNLRNDKSIRYQFLLEELIKKYDDVKVLLLSATPINNNLSDVRNQIKLITHGNKSIDTIEVNNIDNVFKKATTTFTDWRMSDNKNFKEFIGNLPNEFFRITDTFVIARTRKMISQSDSLLTFPKKSKPVSFFITPENIGNYKKFDDIFNDLPKLFTAYRPSAYLPQQKGISVLEDEIMREFYLVKMINILLIKRYESSWLSFKNTVKNILTKHEDVKNKVDNYFAKKENKIINDNEYIEDDDSDIDFIGEKRPINLRDIYDNNKLDSFLANLEKDINCLKKLLNNFEIFSIQVSNENSMSSVDIKLQKLMEIVQLKQTKTNKKVIIFTAYKDTAEYLFSELSRRGFSKLCCIAGDIFKSTSPLPNEKKYNDLLYRFAPYTKLYKDKTWPGFEKTDASNDYERWKSFITSKNMHIKTVLENEIDILIATDVLSEGQNLQDADTVINYDIHWNPVKVIQRVGRIDRIGSPNKEVHSINFWPSISVEEYLNLKSRVEDRMAAMKVIGSEIDENFTETLSKVTSDDSFDNSMLKKMLEKMNDEILIDSDDEPNSVGFDKFSLDIFRQDISLKIRDNLKDIMRIPNGVYTGLINDNKVNDYQIIALLGHDRIKNNIYRQRYKEYELIHIDKNGNDVLSNKSEILSYLRENMNKDRFVPKQIDELDITYISSISSSLKAWLKRQHESPDGTVGSKGLDIIEGLKNADKATIEDAQKGKELKAIYNADKQDLILWFYISNGVDNE